MPPPLAGLPNQSPADLPPVVGDGIIGRDVLSEEQYNTQLEKLVYGSSTESERIEKITHKEIIKENDSINDRLNYDAMNMVHEIDNLLNESDSINSNKNNIETHDADIDDIENLDI